MFACPKPSSLLPALDGGPTRNSNPHLTFLLKSLPKRAKLCTKLLACRCFTLSAACPLGVGVEWCLGGSVANGASRHILIAVPGSGRIVFIPLVNVQKDGLRLLRGIRRTACDICLGCPYVINCIGNVVAVTVTHPSDCSRQKAATCSPFSPQSL